VIAITRLGKIMDQQADLRRQLLAPPLNVFSRLPLLGRIMIAVRDDDVVLERIGVVQKLERDGTMMFCVGPAHDSEINLNNLSQVVVDYSSKMKDKVLPRIEFQEPTGKIVFSVVGLEGVEPFDTALKAFEGVAIERLVKPALESAPATLDADDVGLQPLKAARAAEAEITIEMRRPGVTQRWHGLVPEINPAMGYVNIITSDFHLHLRGGGVTAWKRSDVAADGTVELVAIGPGDKSLGLFLRGPATAFGAA
jgi:putative heme degradation protein